MGKVKKFKEFIRESDQIDVDSTSQMPIKKVKKSKAPIKLPNWKVY